MRFYQSTIHKRAVCVWYCQFESPCVFFSCSSQQFRWTITKNRSFAFCGGFEWLWYIKFITHGWVNSKEVPPTRDMLFELFMCLIVKFVSQTKWITRLRGKLFIPKFQLKKCRSFKHFFTWYTNYISYLKL